jgi:O-antigen/teichoic acid export membrane protein
MSSTSFRKLGRDTVIYGFGAIVNRLASVIMLPVYTRMLTPADYGALELLNMTVDIVSIVVSAGTTAGVMRFYHKATSTEQRHRLLVSAHALQLGLNLLGTLALCLAAPLIWRQVLGSHQSVTMVYLAAVNFTLAGSLAVPSLLIQLQGRAVLSTLAGVTRLLLQLSLNILFLVHFRMGPEGILLSNLIATSVVGGALSVWMLGQTGWRTSRAALSDLRRFGVPYQLTTAGTFILTFGDRFFLEKTRGIAEVGLYALSYNFGFLLAGLTYIPFLTAWNPARHAQAETEPTSRDAAYNRGLLLMSLLTVAGACGIAVFVQPALRIMSDPQFHPAASAVPLILVAIILQAWTDVAKFGIDISERTILVTRGTWLATLVILGLYALLIPPFGPIGAGLATALAFLVRLLYFQRTADRVCPIAYDWMPSLRIFAWFGGVTAVQMLLPPLNLVGALAAGAALFAVFALGALRELPLEDRRAIIGGVRSPKDLVQLLSRG